MLVNLCCNLGLFNTYHLGVTCSAFLLITGSGIVAATNRSMTTPSVYYLALLFFDALTRLDVKDPKYLSDYTCSYFFILSY